MPQRTSPPKDIPLLGLALLLALLTASKPLAALIALDPVLAQSPTSSFSPPAVVPNGTTVRIDGSSSMATINQALKKIYETQYPGTSITLAEEGSDAALKALLNGTVDLAAIGRPLTNQEKQQGLVAKPIARHKIAIIVGPKNSFKGDISFEQFGKIFRGEIKDWSELGGTPGPIRFVDRPNFSDTRQAFQPYPVFQKAPFKTGSNAKQTAKDNTDEVIQALGTDGIGYAIADQVLDRKDVRIIPMHKTLPDDPRYPFSQPLAYVYKNAPSPAVLGFLGIATASGNQAIIEAARETGTKAATDASPATVSPSPTPSPVASATASPEVAAATPVESAQNKGLSPWWLLLLPLIGIPLWLWLRGRGATPAPAAPTGMTAPPDDRVPTPPIPPSAEIPPATGTIPTDAAALAGGTALAAGAGAAGLAGLAASDAAESAAAPIIEPPVVEPPVIEPPVVEPLAVEPPVIEPPVIEPPVASVPTVEHPLPTATAPEGGGLPGTAIVAGGLAAAAGAAALGGLAANSGATNRSHITLTPQANDQALAEWDTPDDHKAEVRQQGGRLLKLRLYDVTGLNLDEQRPQSFQEFPVSEESTYYTTGVRPDRDYLAEIGYLTEDRYWLSLARSNSIRIPSTKAAEMPVVGGATLAAGAGLAALAALSTDNSQSDVEAAKYNVGQTDLSSEALASVDEGLPDLPEGYGDSRIVLMPRDPQWGYAYWDTPNEQKEELRRQGGQRLALRLYDVTDVDLHQTSAHSLQQYDCDELARDWYVPIPVSDRDYVAEIGYLTGDGRWLLLARSNPVRIPPIYPSDWYEDQFISVGWDDDLRGKTLVKLVSPDQQRIAAAANPLYDQIFGLTQSAEALRVAGSLFGSMQHVAGSMQQVPQQAVSSYIFPSGVGMGAVPGVPTMSGLTMSGIGMSGIGFGASMPPIRARKFWLIADAELIIYGATEPDATVTIDGRPIQLNPDGTFRFHMSFQDGVLNFPIIAVAADGEQTRSIHMTFNRETPQRNTNTKDEAVDELF
ncbi:MAG: DUF4912 domain-containing protein [Leptolyngbya sp. BL-A-14]